MSTLVSLNAAGRFSSHIVVPTDIRQRIAYILHSSLQGLVTPAASVERERLAGTVKHIKALCFYVVLYFGRIFIVTAPVSNVMLSYHYWKSHGVIVQARSMLNHRTMVLRQAWIIIR
jgi:hypothetical protein